MAGQAQEISELWGKLLASAGISSVELIALAILIVAFLCLPWIRIFGRVGYNPALGILMVIPVVNVFLFLMFAFHKWPIEKDIRTPDESAYYR